MEQKQSNQTKYRLRLTFAKKRDIKYIAHLDLALAWERAIRRAQIPLAYSQGFNPRPKMQFAFSLPLGAMGHAEIVDIIITEPVAPSVVFDRLRNSLPKGIGLHSVEEVPLKTTALQSLIRQAVYRVTVETDLSLTQVNERIESLLAADKILQTRRRRKRLEEFDMRPWLHELVLESFTEDQIQLRMRVTAGQFGNLRPEAVLKALELADNWVEIERLQLIFAD